MNKIFAERLKELREESGLSIQSLAKKINLGSSSISRWENLQADIKSEQLVVIASFFNVSTDYLLGLDNYR